MERRHVCATAGLETTIASGGRPSPLETQPDRTESVDPTVEASGATGVPSGETVEHNPDIWALRNDGRRLTHGRFITIEEVALGLVNFDRNVSSLSLASDGSTEYDQI